MTSRHRASDLSSALARAMSASSQAPPTPSFFPPKTVTSSNLESSPQSLRLHVEDADFLAIDLEMTGVTSAPWRESFEFDRHDVSDLKVKDSAEKFAVVQVRVCPSGGTPTGSSSRRSAAQLLCFPTDSSDEFLCRTSSVNFLAKHRFDCNTCIHEASSCYPPPPCMGIPTSCILSLEYSSQSVLEFWGGDEEEFMCCQKRECTTLH